MRKTLSALRLCALLLAAIPASQVAAQRPLTHDDYNGWKSVRSTTWSDDGVWVAYAVEPQWGDGEIVVRKAADDDTVYRHPRGSSPVFSTDGRMVFFTIKESEVEKRKERLEELREKGKVAEKRSSSSGRRGSFSFGRGRGGGRRPGSKPRRTGGKGDLGVMNLATGEVEVIERVKGFNAPLEQPFLIWHEDEPKKDDEKEEKTDGEEKEEEEKGERGKKGESGAKGKSGARGKSGAKGESGASGEAKKEEKKKAEEPEKKKGEKSEKPEGEGRSGRGKGKDEKKGWKPKDGTPLVVRDLRTGEDTRIERVVAYGLTGKSSWLYFHTQTKKPQDDIDYGMHAHELSTGQRVELVDGAADYTGFAADDNETGLAFASNVTDLKAEEPTYDLYLWDLQPAPARRIAHVDAAGMPAGKVVSKSGISFSDDGTTLAFGIRNAPEELPKILPEETVKLDLWHHRDGLIQTMQAKQKSRLDNPAWTCAYHRSEDRMVVLGDEDIPSISLITPDGSRALAIDSNPYAKMVTWDGRYSDAYIVNTVDGSRTKFVEKLRGSPRSSPRGRYLVYYEDEHWFSVDVECLAVRNLTADLPVAFSREDDDHPAPRPSHGVAGWSEGDEEVVLYDEFDLWRISPATGEAICVTDGMGRRERTRLRHTAMDRRRDHLPDMLTLAATQIDTMQEGVYHDSLHDLGKPRRAVWLDQHIGGLGTPVNADRLFFTLETFARYPDVWTANADFTDMRKLSTANPQQADIRWGRSELVNWVSTDGVELKGILVVPDDFDPKKKYPMMVYFYEKMSSRLHRYTAPSPGTSPNAAYYVSNGYLWFMPDIVYDVGYPGDSALKCVVSGVQHLIGEGFVQEDAIGAAGHSWGGYQTAYLVTRTDIFKAVESGAPVSNMISAYGGIRWSSGMSRQFQYERTQSRIGGTPWEYPMRYWENSPIFFADKVNTPVLMLHNDEDGAVPWYQGIEYFMALRRLGKETYMFDYVGEPHGLRKRQNQVDWTRRMQQYFDHHLRGHTAPRWMVDGVPYFEREKEKLQHVPSLIEAAATADEASAPTAPAATPEKKPVPAPKPPRRITV